PSYQVQFTRLFLQDLRFRVPQTVARLLEFVYGVWVWIALGLTAFPVFPVVALTRDPARARGLTRRWARRFLKWVRCPVRVEGADRLSGPGPFVLMANHASYMDAAVLMAALPVDFVFVAKEELVHVWLIRPFIRRGGHLTVNRRDLTRGITAVERVRETLSAGLSVLVFPEGTTTRATGLRPFTLGGFKAAAESAAPVCPIALRGTRRILRPDSWMPKRGSVEVTVGPPLTPEGKDWGEILRLRDLSRAEIARHCGEPSLDIVLAGLPAEGEVKTSGND
ncbi:MAG: 1-acyl-sn-glycerol-3-phosphate acyltransferase, partial [Nitrospirae bacterium]|nr:1-acyl-sn-glycerol-3-phosphate acyltransferase [Nitrospirota bacterium]